MNRNQNFKTLDERKKELDNLRTEWKEMKKQEENLKKQFYDSPKNSSERAKIKNQLTRLQREIFDKGECGKSLKFDIKDEELFNAAQNPTGEPTDPKHLANLIKEDLRETLNGNGKIRKGDRLGDYLEISKGKKFWVFADNKEIEKGIENLPRNRSKKPDREKMSLRKSEVKQSDLSSTDFDEILNLIRQVKNFLEEKDKQDRQQNENIALNNPQLFSQWRCSTDGEYNGRRKWENWHTFSGKRNGHNYTIYVPDNHMALTNVLFDDGWGTNSEVGKFFVVEGVAEPTTLNYWNVEKQRNEIISEAEAQRLESQGKGNYIEYKTYVELSDKITIDHYQGDIKQELAKPVSGANQGLVKNDSKNMSGKLITNGNEKAKNPKKIDNDFLLQYFKENDIKEISLTPEGNLLIKYNRGKTEIITNDQVNKPELQKVISYYQENSQTSLSQQDLINNMTNSNSTPSKTPNDNNAILIGCGLGGALIIGILIGLAMRKNKVKKNNL